MKKDQLLDLTLRVSRLTNISAPIIVGSHTLFAATDQIPAIVGRSAECDYLLAAGGIEAIR